MAWVVPPAQQPLLADAVFSLAPIAEAIPPAGQSQMPHHRDAHAHHAVDDAITRLRPSSLTAAAGVSFSSNPLLPRPLQHRIDNWRRRSQISNCCLPALPEIPGLQPGCDDVSSRVTGRWWHFLGPPWPGVDENASAPFHQSARETVPAVSMVIGRPFRLCRIIVGTQGERTSAAHC